MSCLKPDLQMVPMKLFWLPHVDVQYALMKKKFELWEEMLLVYVVFKLADEMDEVIGMICVEDVYSTILVVSEKGFGKRTYLNDPDDQEPVYRITNRGGKGVKTLNITDKTGKLLSIKNVTDEDDLMIITKAGVTIRMHINTIRTMGKGGTGCNADKPEREQRDRSRCKSSIIRR